jgi:hypothetical protein
MIVIKAKKPEFHLQDSGFFDDVELQGIETSDYSPANQFIRCV